MEKRKIIITAGALEMEAELNDSGTAREIWNSLPIESPVNTWGEEIYFSIPVRFAPENARELVEEGDIAFWPSGNCFCIFFGPTPMSTGDEIRPASPVNVVGKLCGKPKEFKKVKQGETIKAEKG